MGRTARFDQIYVASLEAEPVESETLTGVNSILTREIEVNEIKMVEESGIKGRLALANNIPTKQFSVGEKLFIDKDDTIVFDLQARGKASRFFVDDQLAVGTTNPTKAFQVNDGATRKVDIDIVGRDLMTVSGNLVATNVIVENQLTFGSNLIIDGTSSNIITVNGGMKTSNLSVGSNVIITEIGLGGGGSADYPNNVAVLMGNVTVDGGMYIYGNTRMLGNLYVAEQATYERIVNLVISDTTIVFGEGNDGTNEPMLLLTHDQNESNVAFGFRTGDRGKEMALFQTPDGPLDTTFTVDDSVSTNLHVFGDIYTSNNVGVANVHPVHNLCVGSNLFVEDTGSNVLEVFGNTFTENLKVGSNVTIGNGIIVIDTTNKDVAIFDSNVKVNGLRTTGTETSGISNLIPTDTLSIGSRVYINLTAANTLTIFGNTVTTNLITQSISSTSNITVHADRYGGDSLVNPLILKSGPTSSNVSSIEIYGASTSNTHQNIRFKTRNHEKMRITSNGQIGINTTNPTQKLTVNGNAFVMGSNVMMFGNLWGTTSNTSMQIFSSPNVGENKIQNIVKTGKGLNFYASTTPTMGTPKLTILESSNVGINVTNPIGRLHTSGGTVFLNDQPTYRNGYNHLNSSLVVTNTQPIVDTTDLGTVMHLAREGNATRDGVRATFKLGKHDNASGKSKTKMDIYLADEDYTDEVDVMTLQSEGRVGIGTTQPSAHLEVYCTGTANPTTNGILVHNHESPSGDAIVAMQTDINEGNAFTSYIQSDGDVDPSGWAVGVSGSNDFRITQNPNKVYDVGAIGIFIDGTSRDIGIGTDVPRGALEVNGNVVIGQQLSFGGLTGDEFGNTHIIERRYNTDFSRTELLIFKGNEASSVDDGPDRIRHIAGEHVFQTYTSSGDTFYDILDDMDGQTDKPLVVCDNGLVVVGGQRADANGRGANTKLVVNGDIEFAGGGSFKLTGFELSTTTGASSRNIIRNLLDSTVRRPLTFVHEIDDSTDSEFARFDLDGKLGLGTDSPSSNIHIYDTTSGNIDLLKLESGGTNKETGMLIYTDDGEGGYLRGFSNATNGTTGLVMGVANNSTQTNCIHLLHSSNVGIGTHSPATKFHVYDGIPRVESSSSNAIIEFTTTGGSANIYSDTTGNVYINPITTSKTTHVNSDLEIIGDVSVGGNIDLGNQVAIGLSGDTASTDLEIGGGIITNSLEVSKKTYSKTFSIGEGVAKDIQLMFGAGAFYAKVTAILRRTDGSTVKDLSTMLLELQGGTGDGSTSTIDVAIGTKNIFGGTNSYSWSPTVITGVRGISIKPYYVYGTRIYSYDIFVELVSACNGALQKISRDLSSETDLDNGTGGQTQIVAFTY